MNKKTFWLKYWRLSNLNFLQKSEKFRIYAYLDFHTCLEVCSTSINILLVDLKSHYCASTCQDPMHSEPIIACGLDMLST